MEEPRRPAATGNSGPEVFEQVRLSAAAALRRGARVVWLTPPSGAAPAELLHASVADAGGFVVDGRARDLEELASAILKGMGAPPFAGAAGALRAFAAHLRSRGRRLVVGIRHPAALPTRTLRELGALLGRPGDGLALVIESGGMDADLCKMLGVEPTRVRAAGRPAEVTRAAPRRSWRRRSLAIGAGLASGAVLAITLLALWGRGQDRVVMTAAPRAAEAEPDVAPATSPTAVEAPPAAPPMAAATFRTAIPREDPEAVRSGRRALEALANARTDAEWEAQIRTLEEIGPQPALLETLDELGARPGCVRRRGCVSTRDRLHAALCTAWADALERGEVLPGLSCS